MRISLENSLAKIKVNPNGGYIDHYDVLGKHIFFPRLMTKIGNRLKVRGGMHPCLPNFGQDKSLNTLPSHGFGRDLVWQVLIQREDYVKLALDGIDDYEGVRFFLTYELEGANLLASIDIENNSNEAKLVAPGFHPYFYADRGGFAINGKDLDRKDLPNSIYIKAKDSSFIVNSNNIEIIGEENVNQYIVWSDFVGDYICVEPTFSANSFENLKEEVYKLNKGQTFSLVIKIVVDYKNIN